MKLAIMQPYFLPYIGYFQLIAAVDQFIVYDNIKYTKKGWINRNRILQDGKDVMFTLPLKSDSDYLNVCQRELSTEFNREKLLNQFKGAYQRAPYFKQASPLLERLILCEERNLLRYLHHAILQMCAHLCIRTEIRISSEIDINHDLKAQDKVLALCRATGAHTYINAIGGTELYDRGAFRAQGVELKFIRSMQFEYAQFGALFVPWLSIIDVLMFNPLSVVQQQIKSGYTFV